MKEENIERCDEVVNRLAADLRVLALNYFVRVDFKNHKKLLKKFDLNISRFAKRRGTK
jgi:hypothetical protein